MKKYILLISVVAMAMACNNDSSEKKTTDTLTNTTTNIAEPTPNMGKQCYTGVVGRDTVNMTVNIGDTVSGTLDYRFYEKDKNHGLISGVMKGDTLIANYDFSAEGMQSIREVVFLRKENTLVEGNGEMIDRNGKLSFKDISKVKFADGFVLHKTICAK
ncbi:MAG: hypothetical protein ABI480_13120 [Chitinophagaceae bacterium]